RPPEPAGPVQAGSEQSPTNAAALSRRVDTEHADRGLVVLDQLGPRGGWIGDEGDAPDQPLVDGNENLGFTGAPLDIGELPGVAIGHVGPGQGPIGSHHNGTRLFVLVRSDLPHLHPPDASSPGREGDTGWGDPIVAGSFSGPG